MMLGQGHSEEILRTHLARFGCKVEFGIALQEVKQVEDYVVARTLRRDGDKELSETIRCRWLIGADGAKGELIPAFAPTGW